MNGNRPITREVILTDLASIGSAREFGESQNRGYKALRRTCNILNELGYNGRKRGMTLWELNQIIPKNSETISSLLKMMNQGGLVKIDSGQIDRSGGFHDIRGKTTYALTSEGRTTRGKVIKTIRKMPDYQDWRRYLNF